MAFCEQCGTKLNESANFCGNCGKPQDQASDPVQQNPVQAPKAGGMSIISVERKKAFVGMGAKTNVFIYGKMVFKLRNGEKKEISIDNGKHFIHCEGFGVGRSETIEFEGRSNKIGFLTAFPSGWQALATLDGISKISSRPMLDKISESPVGI